jgi:hypothetical protein
MTSNLFQKGLSINKPPIFSKIFPSVNRLTLNSNQQQKQTSLISSSKLVTANDIKKNFNVKNVKKTSKDPNLIPGDIKVVTDIDDTVVSSGGLNIFGITLGGVDKQYKRGSFYPGVIQFALELSKPKNFGSNKEYALSKVSVLTARAKEFKFALELKANGKLCSAYRNIGENNGLKDWGIGDVYYGSVAEWIFQGRKGLRKFLNFEIMLQNDKKVNNIDKYIIIGDTGEKDEEAGERIALKYPNKLKAIFLHSVSKNGNNSAPSPDRKVNGVPVYYFKTYVGAAIKAYNNNLISKEGLKKVTEQAVYELIKQDNNNILPSSKIASRWNDLVSDINECTFLQSYGDEIPNGIKQIIMKETNYLKL